MVEEPGVILRREAVMKYSTNIDYLFASIVYLGTHEYYWARTPQSMASELRLDEGRLQEIFEEFPGIFRKSTTVSPENKQHYYSLQARYALKEGKDIEDVDNEQSFIKAMQPAQLEVVIDFVLKMAEQESKELDQQLRREEQKQSRNIGLRANFVAVAPAVIAAIAAVVAALITHPLLQSSARLLPTPRLSKGSERQISLYALVNLRERLLAAPDVLTEGIICHCFSPSQ